MKKVFVLLLTLCLLTGCMPRQSAPAATVTVAATTAPVAQFAEVITAGTDVQVSCVVNEPVSCLHDYTLSVAQMELLEKADAVILSGLGLEDFMTDILSAGKTVIDASRNAEVIAGDVHYWLDPEQAEEMAEAISDGLSLLYPQFAPIFERNAELLENRLDQLDGYAETQLRGLRIPGLVTFHDGFRYFADFIDAPLLAAMEVESGSEMAAKDLMEIVTLVENRKLPAVFTEVNGDSHAAQIVAAETGCRVYALDTAMGGTDYFDAMKVNIDTIREAFS